MNEKYTNIHDKAFELKNEGKFQEAIDEFKAILKRYPNDGLAAGMIAALYYSELDDPKSSLPYAKKAVSCLPRNENASFCLSLCLFQLDEKDQMRSEIKRYIGTGGKIDLYRTLFEENDLTIEDFT